MPRDSRLVPRTSPYGSRYCRLRCPLNGADQKHATHASALVDNDNASRHLRRGLEVKHRIRREQTMRCLKIALAVALAAGSLSSIASTANATIVARGVNTAADRLNLVDQVEFVFGGHKHCWYHEGWHGP